MGEHKSKGGIILPFTWKGDFPDKSVHEAAQDLGIAPKGLSRKVYHCHRCKADLSSYVKDGKEPPLVCDDCVAELLIAVAAANADGVPVGNRGPGFDNVRGGVAPPRR